MTTADRVNSGKRVTKHEYVTVHSDVLNLDFRAKVSDPRSRRLECFVSAMEYLALNPKRR
jgi:hypothetical protein